MSRTLLLAGLLVLGACSVETEGAACRVLGDDAVCPSGQRCGIDRKCAKDAITKCLEPAGKVGVDKFVGGTAVGITPTGYADIEVCRLPDLAAAVALAKQKGISNVRIYKGTERSEFTLSATLELPAGFSVSSDGTADDVRVTVAGPAGDPVVRIATSASLSNVRLETSIDRSAPAIEVDCSATGQATLSGVEILGGMKVTRGISIVGGCGLVASNVDVSGAKAEGVWVELTDAAAEVTINSGAVHGNVGTGVYTKKGKVEIVGTEVHGNELHGLFAEWSDAAIDLQVTNAILHDNRGVGLYVRNLSGSPTSRLVVTGTFLRANAGTASPGYGSSQKAGGLLLWGAPPSTVVFRGNTFCNNGGAAADEVAVNGTGWTLGASGAPQCSSEGNRIYDSSGILMWGVSSTNKVQARHNYWFSVGGGPPPAGTVINTDDSDTCGALLTAPSGC